MRQALTIKDPRNLLDSQASSMGGTREQKQVELTECNEEVKKKKGKKKKDETALYTRLLVCSGHPP